MVIGFDFDKVFINYPPFIPYSIIDFLYKGSSVFRKNKTRNTNLTYRFPGVLEQKLRIISHAPLLRQPIKENILALRKIRQTKNCKTYLVSSRFGFLKSRTNKLITKHKFNDYFSGVYFNYDNKQPHLFKEETIRKLKIDTYIDDDLDLALYLSKRNPNLRLFWLRDGRKENLELPDNITPISNLNELVEKYLNE